MPDNLKGKKILLGVSGSIAAYKVAYLIRGLIKIGAEVKVIMTPAATSFISPLTLSTLSKHEVLTDVTDGSTWHNHVELGLWADIMLIAPCTATTLGKLANGIADNMLVATYLSAKCPVWISPAMDLDMWIHGSTKRNLSTLQSYGNHILPVGYGELASGLVGEGRMAEPEDIIQQLSDFFTRDKPLTNKTVIVTAGPTYEPIDPVRFIGNRSSGKMGIAIANAFVNQGATVHLVLGPSYIQVSSSDKMQVHKVHTAADMFESVLKHYAQSDIVVFAAAVADYTPQTVSDHKIKKSDSDLGIPLKRTIDIAGTLGSQKSNQFHVGFALETRDGETYALGKLYKKNFDIVVLNTLEDEGAGFGHDTNKVKIFFKDGSSDDWPLMKKNEVAERLVHTVITKL